MSLSECCSGLEAYLGVTGGGSLVMVVNKPTNVACDPGGSSYFFQLAAATGGGIQKVVGGADYYDAGFALASALSDDTAAYAPVLSRARPG